MVLNKWWVIYGGELFEAVVFKEKSTFTKSVEYPIDGSVGYIVRKHKEIELEFSEKHQVWHEKGKSWEIPKHQSALRKREISFR